MKLEKRDLLYRPRRLRKSDNLRRLVRETRLHSDDLIAPVFVINGNNIQNEIPSMPGIYQFSYLPGQLTIDKFLAWMK